MRCNDAHRYRYIVENRPVIIFFSSSERDGLDPLSYSSWQHGKIVIVILKRLTRIHPRRQYKWFYFLWQYAYEYNKNWSTVVAVIILYTYALRVISITVVGCVYIGEKRVLNEFNNTISTQNRIIARLNIQYINILLWY